MYVFIYNIGEKYKTFIRTVWEGVNYPNHKMENDEAVHKI